MKANQFKVYVTNLFKARFPYIYISTWEEDRALSAIRAVCEDESLITTPRTVITWRSTTGILGEGQPGKEETKAPLKALEQRKEWGIYEPHPNVVDYDDANHIARWRVGGGLACGEGGWGLPALREQSGVYLQLHRQCPEQSLAADLETYNDRRNEGIHN
jgi:hypothetical protein